MPVAASCRLAAIERQTKCRLIKPTRYGLSPFEGGCFPGQDQECGLKGVLGILVVGQDATANSPDQRSIPPDQRGKSIFIAGGCPAGHKLVVRRRFMACRIDKGTKVLDQEVGGITHDGSLRQESMDTVSHYLSTDQKNRSRIRRESDS